MINTQTEQLLNNLNSTFEWVQMNATDAVDTTSEFLVEQTPLYIQEFILWFTVKSMMGALFCLLLMVTTLIVCKPLLKKIKNGPDHYESGWSRAELYACVYTPLILINIPLGIVSSGYISTLLKVYLAPRVFIVEQLSNLVT